MDLFSEEDPSDHAWSHSMLSILDNKPRLCTSVDHTYYVAGFEGIGEWYWGSRCLEYWEEVFPEQELFT